TQPWETPAGHKPRLAGVSSFGSGGTNAHVVVAEFASQHEERPVGGQPVLFLLSARSLPQLQVYARKYLDWLTTGRGVSVSLNDLAHQLQTGRQHMELRLALVVTDHRELIDKLSAFAAAPERFAYNSRAAASGMAALARSESGKAMIRSLAAGGDL